MGADDLARAHHGSRATGFEGDDAQWRQLGQRAGQYSLARREFAAGFECQHPGRALTCVEIHLAHEGRIVGRQHAAQVR